jgi:exopolysaccharide biosynthesis polyprenyl glycosylphosphotransferase
VAGDVTACALAIVLHHRDLLPLGAFAALLVWFAGDAGLYQPRLRLSLLDDVAALMKAALAALAGVALLLALVAKSHDVTVLVNVALLVVPALLTVRAGLYATVRFARAHRLLAQPLLIIGYSDLARTLASELASNPSYGVVPVGFLDEAVDGVRAGDLPLLGRLSELPTLIRRLGIANVIVAGPAAPAAAVQDVVRACTRLDLEIFVVPRLYQVHSHAQLENVHGIPLIRLRRLAHRAPTWRLKRLFDVLASTVALVFAAPILAAAALAVRLEGGPGVIFRQQRVGLDGEPFDVLKLRSLRPVDETESATTWCIAHDDRLGPVGRFLRRTSIDELPQLWNVLRGDMSLVGPRPERPYFVARFSRLHDGYAARHRMPVGLTGLAQVHGLRGDTSIEDRCRFDNHYIDHWSLWQDVCILLRTAAELVRPTGS